MLWLLLNETQVVIITGASSGIGLTTTLVALSEGAQVLGVDVSSPPTSLDEHPKFAFCQGNLVDPCTPQKVVSACNEAYGRRIDALLNIAGVMDHNQSADSVVDSVWDRCIAVNLTAPVRLMREVLPIMREQKSGSIVNVASKAALSGAVSGIAYTASELPFDFVSVVEGEFGMTRPTPRQTRSHWGDQECSLAFQA